MPPTGLLDRLKAVKDYYHGVDGQYTLPPQTPKTKDPPSTSQAPTRNVQVSPIVRLAISMPTERPASTYNY